MARTTGKQSNSKKKTRQKFIETFWALYKTKPVNKITVSEITKITGNSRNTFYAHFMDVYEILDIIEEDIMKTQSMCFDNIQTAQMMSKEDFIHISIDAFEQVEEYLQVFFHGGKNPSFKYKLLENHRDSAYKFLKSMNHAITYVEEIEIEYVLYGFSHAVIHWIENKPCSKEELVQRLIVIISTSTLATIWLEEAHVSGIKKSPTPI